MLLKSLFLAAPEDKPDYWRDFLIFFDPVVLTDLMLPLRFDASATHIYRADLTHFRIVFFPKSL